MRRLYADWARGDYSNTAIFDPGVVGHAYGILPGGETEVQRVEELGPTVSAYLQSWQRPFIVEALEFVEQDERIAVFVRWKGRSKAGGAEIEAENVHLWAFREGKAIRFDVYSDRERAMAALRASRDDAADETTTDS